MFPTFNISWKRRKAFYVSTLIIGRMFANQQINMLSLQSDIFKSNFFNLKWFTVEELKKEDNS
jgi:hypothetical protein